MSTDGPKEDDRHGRQTTPLSRVTGSGRCATAIALADAEGIGSLSMRRLAQELGVEAMSLYHHVANKDDILDGMVDMVFGEIELPSDGADWKTAMRDRARSARAAMTRHPWAISLMESRSSPGPATLRHHDAVHRRLPQGRLLGRDDRARVLADRQLHLRLRAAGGATCRSTTRPTWREVVESMMLPFSAEDYPHLVELTTEHILQAGLQLRRRVRHTAWALILDSLEAALGD